MLCPQVQFEVQREWKKPCNHFYWIPLVRKQLGLTTGICVSGVKILQNMFINSSYFVNQDSGHNYDLYERAFPTFENVRPLISI